MTIGLISDTHGYLGEDVVAHLKDCDEIWHAGDIGDMKTAKDIESLSAPVRMVWGNIDGSDLRLTYDKDIVWISEGLKVYMTHIGGYPGRYAKVSLQKIKIERPGLFISGHSHILKVMNDKANDLLHMNPGACGYIGFHKFRTILKFEISSGKVKNLKAIELGLRGKTKLQGLQ